MVRLRVISILLLACCSAPAVAAQYPERPIRYIVPSAAGGGADISARLLTGDLSGQLNAGIAQACASLRQKLEATGQECATKSPQEFVRFVKDEQVKWGDIVRKSGAKVD